MSYFCARSEKKDICRWLPEIGSVCAKIKFGVCICAPRDKLVHPGRQLIPRYVPGHAVKHFTNTYWLLFRKKLISVHASQRHSANDLIQYRRSVTVHYPVIEPMSPNLKFSGLHIHIELTIHSSITLWADAFYIICFINIIYEDRKQISLSNLTTSKINTI
jgi:hypothetical protein